MDMCVCVLTWSVRQQHQGSTKQATPQRKHQHVRNGGMTMSRSTQHTYPYAYMEMKLHLKKSEEEVLKERCSKEAL